MASFFVIKINNKEGVNSIYKRVFVMILHLDYAFGVVSNSCHLVDKSEDDS